MGISIEVKSARNLIELLKAYPNATVFTLRTHPNEDHWRVTLPDDLKSDAYDSTQCEPLDGPVNTDNDTALDVQADRLHNDWEGFTCQLGQNKV